MHAHDLEGLAHPVRELARLGHLGAEGVDPTATLLASQPGVLPSMSQVAAAAGVTRLDRAPDAVTALRAAVRVQATIKPRLHGVAAGLELLRPVDDGAAAACQEREGARLSRCRAVVDRLAAEGRLAEAWTPAEAAELLWSMTSLRAWEDLVIRAGWTDAEWTRRTTIALEAALVADDDQQVRQPRGAVGDRAARP